MSDQSAVEQKKLLRELLGRALTKKIPRMPEEEFQRLFSMQQTPDMTYAELMMTQLVLKACTGNDKSIQEVLDRLVGKPVQTAEIRSVAMTYNDFLMSCVEEDQKDKLNVIDVEPQKPETDLLADLM